MNRDGSEQKITYRGVTSLKGNPHNARTHSKRQIRQIARSIEKFGFTNPILIDRNEVIIAGHGRVAAAKLLGIKRVPTIQLEDLTEDEVRAYIMADNRLAESAGWDRQILAIELQHIITTDNDLDVTDTGFEIAEIDLIIEEDAVRKDADDELPADDAAPPIAQLGDLWQLGPHRVYCGSALDSDAYETLMEGKLAGVAIIDPPFNIPIAGNVSGKGVVKHEDFAMACGEMNEAEFSQFLRTSFEHLAKHSLPGSFHYIAMDWRHMGDVLSVGNDVYGPLLNLCCWVKDRGGQGSLYRSRHELFFVFKNGKGSPRNNVMLGKYGRYRTNVWEYPASATFSRNGEEGNLLALHPTVKPVALIADAILDCSARGEIVLDTFLGSGTTLIAAERTGRICYGIELSPQYVDVAIRRWQRHTGSQAVHAVTGRRFDEVINEVLEVTNG